MKGKNKTVHPWAMEQEKKIKSRLQSLHTRCNAVNKQAKEALIDVFCTDFEQMSARDRWLMEQALFAQLTSTKTMMEKTLISSRKKQLEKEYHLYLLLINELGWSEKLADEDRDILSIKHKIAANISATSNKKSKKSDTQSQFISWSGVIANGRQTQNNQQDYNSGIVQNLQNSHIIYNGPVYMGMHSPWATSPAPAPSTPAPAPSTPAPAPSSPAPVPSSPAPVPSSPDSIPSSPDEDTSTNTPDEDLPHVGEEHPQHPSPTHPIVVPEEEEQATDNQAPQSSTEGLNIEASLSDMKAVYEQTAILQAEEELRADYKNTSSWNLYKRAKFFLLRGRMRKAKIAELMKGYQKLPFTHDHQVNQTLEAASTRHQLQYQFEEQSGIQSVSFIDIPEVNQLASQFVTGDIDEEHFQVAFNTFVTNDPRFQQMLALGRVEYIGTNLLQQLRFEKAQYALLEALAEALQKGENTDQIQQKIEYFLREYQQNPFFLQEIKQDLEAGDLEKLQRYFAHQKAKRALELKNLKIKLSLLTWGKSAYQIDASDQEKGWLVKLGKKIDQLPAWAQIGGGIWIGAVAGLLGGPLGLGVVGTSVLTTGTFAGVSGFKNFIKKRTHYTKEHTTHEKNLTHSFEHQQQQIAKWQYDMTQRGAKNWRKRYRAKRQLALYQEATQHSFLKTKDISHALMVFSSSLRSLTSEDKNQLSWILVLVKARLDAYKQTGHNFLASDRPEEVESDMQDLYQAMQLAVNKLGIRFEEINQLQFANSEGESYSYDAIYESLITEYEAAKKKFSSQRRSLAAKYGIGHAALSALTAGALQKFMGTGMFASEASTQTIDVSGDLQHIQHFGLGEHLLDDDNQIVSKVKDQILSLSQAGQLDVYYGAGTDATWLLANSPLSDPDWYTFKIEEVIEQIELLDLTDAQKNLFIEHIQSRPWEVDWAKDFTHDYLHGGRCAEGLLHLARGLEASGNTELLPQLHYDAGKSIAGELAHHNLDRNFALNLHFQDQASSIQVGTGRSWWVPIMSFANTFKKTNDGHIPESVLLDETNHNSDDREQNSNSEESEPLQERNTSDDQTSAFSFEEAEENEYTIERETGWMHTPESRVEENADHPIEIAASSADKIIDVADFSLERLDFDKYTYLMHQTDQISAKGIAEVGLQHKGALTSTTYFAGKISLPQTVEKMKAGERHRGSDSLVIFAFPKDQFPITPRGTQSASDQIEEHLQLMGYPHSVPAEYVKNIIMFPS